MYERFSFIDVEEKETFAIDLITIMDECGYVSNHEVYDTLGCAMAGAPLEEPRLQKLYDFIVQCKQNGIPMNWFKDFLEYHREEAPQEIQRKVMTALRITVENHGEPPRSVTFISQEISTLGHMDPQEQAADHALAQEYYTVLHACNFPGITYIQSAFADAVAGDEPADPALLPLFQFFCEHLERNTVPLTWFCSRGLSLCRDILLRELEMKRNRLLREIVSVLSGSNPDRE